MPPKLKAKPKPVPRRGAAAAGTSAASEETAVAPTPTVRTEAEAASLAEPTGNTVDEPPKTAVEQPPELPAEIKPVPPPKGRLDSLTPSRQGTPIRGGAGGLKFKPKLVARKTKEERDRVNAQFEAEQAKKAAEAEAAAAAAGAGRGRGGTRGMRGGRGRGRGGRGGADMPSAASGPFALGSIISGQKKVIAERSTFLNRNKVSSFKFPGGSRRPRGDGKEGEEGDAVKPEYSSSDESDAERLDVEYIGMLDEDEEDENADWGTGAPIRIPRIEHVDRQAMVNTEASSKKSKAQQEQEKAKEMTFETEIKIKDEPESDEDVVMVPPPNQPVQFDEYGEPMLPDLIPSPETIRRKKAAKKKVRVSESPDAERKKGSMARRRSSGTKKKKPVITTTEEKEEYERRELDLMVALRELGGALPDLKAEDEAEVKDKDGDVAMADQEQPVAPATEALPQHSRNVETENQIFFFQFPTLLPQLTNAAPPTTAAPGPGPSAPADGEAPPTSKKPLSKKQQYKMELAALTDPPPSGLVGKMRVHKSGRITMLWGDPADDGHFVMEVNRGAQVEFLQEMVVMKEESPFGEDDKDEKGNRKGVAYSLGQVKGKYVVSPDFEKLIRESARRGKGKAKEEAVVVD